MKKIIFVVALSCAVFACTSPKKETQQADTATAELVGNYGDKIEADGAITTEKMLALLAESDSVHVKVEGEILATCAKKGCWMNLVLDDGEEMRVTFKDYGFFVPTEGMEGNRAVIEGVVTKVTTDVATLQHYAEDAGKTQAEIDLITEPKEEFSFEASGVIIYSEDEASL